MVHKEEWKDKNNDFVHTSFIVYRMKNEFKYGGGLHPINKLWTLCYIYNDDLLYYGKLNNPHFNKK